MRQITRRAARTAVGTAAVVAALALPLTLGASAAVAADTPPAPVVIEDDLGDPPMPKPEKPTEDTGSWVWDKFEP
ncbi:MULTISPECIES: hypothetical protein [unclassified Streptomyces]|uniref:hypothetical protein n=1 Tax=unclassified Streptomyces TaxID=2593676 RepID=UPI003D71324B